MTDSVDDKRDNSKEAILARMDQYGRRSPQERTEFTDLPTWVRTACAYKYLVGLSWKEAAERVGKKPATLDIYKTSPAFKAWRAELEAAALDPKAMAELVMKSHALGVTLDYLAAFQKAVEANDFKATAGMAQDILDRIGVQKKQSKRDAPSTIHITLTGGTASVPIIEAEYEMLESDSRALPPGE